MTPRAEPSSKRSSEAYEVLSDPEKRRKITEHSASTGARNGWRFLGARTPAASMSISGRYGKLSTISFNDCLVYIRFRWSSGSAASQCASRRLSLLPAVFPEEGSPLASVGRAGPTVTETRPYFSRGHRADQHFSLYRDRAVSVPLAVNEELVRRGAGAG